MIQFFKSMIQIHPRFLTTNVWTSLKMSLGQNENYLKHKDKETYFPLFLKCTSNEKSSQVQTGFQLLMKNHRGEVLIKTKPSTSEH